jgi:hypothetical protein
VVAGDFRIMYSQSVHSSRCAGSRPGAWCGLLAAVVLAACSAAADDGPCETSADIDAWVISTRRLPAICGLPSTAIPTVEQCVDPRCGRWERSDLATLLADPTQPLLVFIHGNRYTSAAAKSQGLQLARQCRARCPGGRQPRLVIFSWPSEQQGILLKDGRAKFSRAHADGHYLAWLLGQVEPERPVALVGYSFGALITLEALDDLVAAGRAGRSGIHPWEGRPGRTHLVLVAAAVRCDALAPRGPYHDATGALDRLTLVNNSRDDALKFFPLLDREVGADALGYSGMAGRWLPADIEYSATDGAAIIGKHHGLPLYLASPSLTARIAVGALDSLDASR